MVKPDQRMKPGSALKSWALVVFIGVAIIAWFLLNYLVLGSRAPVWDYGAVPAVPAESRYSTEPLPRSQPRQVELPPPVKPVPPRRSTP